LIRWCRNRRYHLFHTAPKSVDDIDKVFIVMRQAQQCGAVIEQVSQPRAFGTLLHEVVCVQVEHFDVVLGSRSGSDQEVCRAVFKENRPVVLFSAAIQKTDATALLCSGRPVVGLRAVAVG
jgi:hypothetical protein